MKLRLRWIALIAALAIPALGWAATSGKLAGFACPFGCSAEHCPLGHR